MSRTKSYKEVIVSPIEVIKEIGGYNNWTKDQYITEISKASNRGGDKLIHLMDLNKANNLAVITIDQARDYYLTYILNIN